LARAQGAQLWELRTAVSLARHLAIRGERAEAGSLLASVYEKFTEGFDAADLVEARVLLRGLGLLVQGAN
jgi:predicted ATPase